MAIQVTFLPNEMPGASIGHEVIGATVVGQVVWGVSGSSVEEVEIGDVAVVEPISVFFRLVEQINPITISPFNTTIQIGFDDSPAFLLILGNHRVCLRFSLSTNEHHVGDKFFSPCRRG